MERGLERTELKEKRIWKDRRKILRREGLSQYERCPQKKHRPYRRFGIYDISQK